MLETFNLFAIWNWKSNIATDVKSYNKTKKQFRFETPGKPTERTPLLKAANSTPTPGRSDAKMTETRTSSRRTKDKFSGMNSGLRDTTSTLSEQINRS